MGVLNSLKLNNSAGYGPFGAHTFSTYNDRLVQALDGPDLLPVRVRHGAVALNVEQDSAVLVSHL